MDAEAVPNGGGILGRFDNVRQRKSNKKILACDAATAEYLRHDYLKPAHLPADVVDGELNFGAASNIHETRFHKGFQRRHQSDIQQDAARFEAEMTREAIREHRSQASVEAVREYKEKHSFNILTGEGNGRESEFRQVGKKILNPYGCMEAVYAEHGRDASNRQKSSKHRFFEHLPSQPPERTGSIFQEGLRDTARETVVLGYGSSGKRRTRLQSCGVADNFAHLNAMPPEPQYEAPPHGNRSQIILG